MQTPRVNSKQPTLKQTSPSHAQLPFPICLQHKRQVRSQAVSPWMHD
jgi:hypothetical protein